MPWFDGTLHAEKTLPFDVTDRGLLLGDGAFDTALVLRGTIVWRGAHLTRLAAACRTLGFPLDAAAVDRAIAAVVTDNIDGSLRITVTHGPGPRGLAPPPAPQPKILVSFAPLRAKPFFAPLSLHVSGIRRNETSPTSRLKSLNYLDAVLASREAVRHGFADALFLNTREHVACATVGNIVVLHEGRLITPPLADGVVAGTARAALLRLAEVVGLEPAERSVTLDDLAQADAVFVGNSLKLLAPVTRIGAVEKPVPTDLRCAALIAALCTAIKEDCGTDPRRL
ncbi:aminotransferase class IV [Beijerinckia sp. L45]|uniref:aminotransferase class IV n=1 Tax=Beijerinckia sp. L45 TaxID=1641855 RepID=UPI00131E03A5|nr:aminotransferase class IV [Beijerinckia sp. L45]